MTDLKTMLADAERFDRSYNTHEGPPLGFQLALHVRVLAAEVSRLRAELDAARAAARYAVGCLYGASDRGSGDSMGWTRKEILALAKDIVRRWPWTEPGVVTEGESK